VLARAFHHLPLLALLALGALSFFATPWAAGAGPLAVAGIGAALLAAALLAFAPLPVSRPAPQDPWRWIFAVLIAGAALRLAWVLAVSPVQSSDMEQYVAMARGLLNGEGYHEQVGAHDLLAYRAPGYAFILAATFALLGDHPGAPAALNILVFLGSGLLIHDILARLAGVTAGIFATALFTLWPSGIMVTGLAFTEMPSVLLLLVVAWSLVRGAEDPGWRWWSLGGIALGLGALVRPSLLPLPALLIVLSLLDPRRSAASLRHSVLAAAVAAMCVLPWTVRNYEVLGAFVAVSTNGGDNFYRANNPLADGGYTPDGELDFSSLLPDEARWNRVSMDAGKAWIAENPGAFLRLAARKLAISFGEDSTGAYWSLERGHGIKGSAYTFAVLVSNAWWLAVWGLTMTALYRHRDWLVSNPGPAALMWLAVFLPAVHAVFESQPRYHMPIVGILLCLTGTLMRVTPGQSSMTEGGRSP
jgi:4-amino-4-deoxy-L-arabinose transferase-like glycosyltransferase